MGIAQAAATGRASPPAGGDRGVGELFQKERERPGDDRGADAQACEIHYFGTRTSACASFTGS